LLNRSLAQVEARGKCFLRSAKALTHSAASALISSAQFLAEARPVDMRIVSIIR